MKAAWIILTAAVLSFGQTAKKENPPTAKKASGPAAKPDTWQKSKECATQAEKVIADRNIEIAQAGGSKPLGWNNHYSPKYNRCFVRVYYVEKDPPKGGPLSSTVIIDAFERVVLASTAVGLAPEIACRVQEKPAECEEFARVVWKVACGIENEPTDCTRAKQFIDEHMKN